MEFWLTYIFRIHLCLLVLSLAFLGGCQPRRTENNQQSSGEGDTKTNLPGSTEIKELLDATLRSHRRCLFVGSFPTDAQSQSPTPLFTRLSHLGVLAEITTLSKRRLVLTKKGEQSYDRKNQQLCYATPQLITIEDVSVQTGGLGTVGKVTYSYKLLDVEPWALDSKLQADYPKLKLGLDHPAEASAYFLYQDQKWSVRALGLE
jgi:hypothetical protein